MLEIMSETPPPPGAALSKLPRTEVSGTTHPHEPGGERLRLPENRTLQITGFNTLFKFYEDANRPLWERLERGENLSDQERKDAIGYKITLDGVERLTAEPHIAGQRALPHTIPSDEFINTYKTPDGRTRKQREGLVTNHMTAWADREIGAGNEDRALHLSREVVWENSLPYPQLHTSAGSISLEDRINQEAGAFVHDTGEGEEGRNIHGVKIRDSQHPANTSEHSLDDWVMAEHEMGGREEYVIDPPLPTDAITFVNPPRLEVDDDVEPRHVYIPDRVENGPARPGRVRSRRPEEEIRQWIGDLGGGVSRVGKVNVVSDYRVPALRETGSEPVQPPTIREVRPSEETRARGIMGTSWGRGLGDRVRSLVTSLPSVNLKRAAKWLGIAVGVAAVALLNKDDRATSTHQAAKTTEGATRESFMPNRPMPEVVDARIIDGSVAPTGPKFSEAAFNPAKTPEESLHPQVQKPEFVATFQGGGKGLDTKKVDFSLAEDEQQIKGLTEDQLAQMVNPQYREYVASMKAKGQNVNPSEGWSSGTMLMLQEEMEKKYGEARGKEVYQSLINTLTERMKYVLRNYNPEVVINAYGDIVDISKSKKEVTLYDLGREAQSDLDSIIVNGQRNELPTINFDPRDNQ